MNKPVALIPARAQSKRIPRKNIRQLGGHPLLAYTIAAALGSGIFSDVIVSTECQKIAEVARSYGAHVPFLRPEAYSADLSPDIDWVRHALLYLAERGTLPDYYFLLRPTNPFRQSETIVRAWEAMKKSPWASSLRAVQKCHEHPYKMWKIQDGGLQPLFVNPDEGATPWHSTPYQSLPEIFVQNASLEIAKTSLPLMKGVIAEAPMVPFVSEGYEGFDLNFPMDWELAELMVNKGVVRLPTVSKAEQDDSGPMGMVP
ncbi:acylneuraminate cytidylyltransferase family protein [Pseudodesulfovibrio cashew]|uniref:Acylneuraminate cytidylyltransferase family protein n=1 Tax=Pseudodesulfovibrio cashew TaxID=2678688 RepID=A0A6I6JG40_9BACT|nr:acylneuraminate cytidylyltransferase family protein [Pseudodesulfovibrio cashew]QGY39007.1 acylneuraminate cytidylyltransferase family protein [Pseudodesulfovibrio cashew]